jgi:hypothetical protein
VDAVVLGRHLLVGFADLLHPAVASRRGEGGGAGRASLLGVERERPGRDPGRFRFFVRRGQMVKRLDEWLARVAERQLRATCADENG